MNRGFDVPLASCTKASFAGFLRIFDMVAMVLEFVNKTDFRIGEFRKIRNVFSML